MDSARLKAILDEAVKEHGFVHGLFMTVDGQVLATSGDPGALKWQGLLSRLFGSEEAIRQVAANLDDKLLPEVWSQGELRCALAKPADELLFAVFAQDGRAGYDLFEEVKALSEGISRKLDLRG